MNNPKSKLCIHCKWVVAPFSLDESKIMCQAPQNVIPDVYSLVTGKPIYKRIYAIECRDASSKDSSCGWSGEWFEPMSTGELIPAKEDRFGNLTPLSIEEIANLRRKVRKTIGDSELGEL